MKLLTAKILFWLGDKYSEHFPDMLFYYPLYNWLMTTSAELDVDAVIWTATNKKK